MEQNQYEEVYKMYIQQSKEEALKESDGKEISPGQEEIVAVRKNDDGDLIAFKTNSGHELNYIEALELAKNGRLAHVDVFHKYGRDILRSEPDGIKENNLDQLPRF